MIPAPAAAKIQVRFVGFLTEVVLTPRTLAAIHSTATNTAAPTVVRSRLDFVAIQSAPTNGAAAMFTKIFATLVRVSTRCGAGANAFSGG
jgi:hypothetical protein